MNNKWNNHTQKYLKTVAIWTDLDLVKFAMISFIAGVITGWLI